MTEIEKLLGWVNAENNCLEAEGGECSGCPYESSAGCIAKVREAIKTLIDINIPVEVVTNAVGDYFCGKCGVKITNAIKIYDGERYMVEHPDHLKPAQKWEYCKHCGRPVKWK